MVKLRDNVYLVLLVGGLMPDSAEKAADETYKGDKVVIVF